MYGERMEELFDRWAAAAFDRELWMLERYGPGLWTGDRKRGVIRKDGVEQPAQFLGCESECGKRWTWGWAYPAGEVPEHALAAVRRLREHGRDEELLALIVPSFDLGGRCGHLLGMIASGVLGAEFYVECESDEGSLYFASTLRAPPRPKDPLARVFRVFPQLVGHPDCGVKDQKRAFRAYLAYYGFELETSRDRRGELLCGLLPGTRRIIMAGFDANNRAIGLAEGERTKRSRRPRSVGGAV